MGTESSILSNKRVPNILLKKRTFSLPRHLNYLMKEITMHSYVSYTMHN